jgi:HupE/UreJ protein
VLPTRFVSSSLALSVIYVAAENLFIKEVSHRSWVAVFFGLIYGLGFSNLIQDMGLPEEGRVTALLGYQAGVGLSIACTVAVVYATVAWVGRLQRQRQAMALTSLCFMAFGIFEFVQRTF